jgi:hypothetical protein
MADNRTLAERIDAELGSARERSSKLKQQVVDHEPGRWQRLEQVDKKLTSIRSLWRDRLAELSNWFGDRLKVQAQMASGRRQATFAVKSSKADIELRFSAFTDDDVRNVIFQYDLDISPAPAAYDAHSELSFPIDQLDEMKLADWLYDRMIAFVKTYLAIHEE